MTSEQADQLEHNLKAFNRCRGRLEEVQRGIETCKRFSKDGGVISLSLAGSSRVFIPFDVVMDSLLEEAVQLRKEMEAL